MYVQYNYNLCIIKNMRLKYPLISICPLLTAYDMRIMETKVKHIVQSIKDNVQDLPHSVEFELDCRGPGVMIDLYTSVNLEKVMKFRIPVNEINATMNIDHFHPENDGVYYCVVNVSSYANKQFVLVSNVECGIINNC